MTTSRMRRSPALLLPLVISACMLGCQSGMPEPRPPRPPAQVGVPLPAYDEVAERYNARIAALPRLWARTTGRIWFLDEDGRSRTEQVEGHLQYMAPDRLLLNFDKVAQTYGLMGTNADRYWWIELDRQPRAYIGEHARVTAERIAELNLPIYPRDVIDLLGITPLPAASQSPSTSIAWTQDRTLLMVQTTIAPSSATPPAQPGAQPPLSPLRRIYINPSTYEPVRVEILSADEQLRAVSQLSDYETVAVRGAGPEVTRPRIPLEIYVGTADENTTMRLRMSAPEISPRRPTEAIFDFDQLVRIYSIGEVISLDEPRAAAR